MGDPDTVIKVLKGYEAAGVDPILCFMQMGNLSHSRIMDSINLYGKYIAFCNGLQKALYPDDLVESHLFLACKELSGTITGTTVLNDSGGSLRVRRPVPTVQAPLGVSG